MTTTSASTKLNAVETQARRAPSAAQTDWSGAGWIDSSWELMHGLVVVEDYTTDAWPADLPPPTPQPVFAGIDR